MDSTENTNAIIIQPKKRGRKPKPKELINIDIIPKKRGRKPKIKSDEQINNNQVINDDTIHELKKRGRKPMGKILDLENANSAVNTNNNLLNFLPLQPYEIENIIKNSNRKDNIETSKMNIFNLKEESINNVSSNKIEKNFKNSLIENEFIKLQIENKELKDCIEQLKKDTEIKREIIKMDELNIVDQSGKQLKETTKLHCWWCTCQFDTIPIGIPEKYDANENKYCVFGCFCSFNCAYAWNVHETNDYKTGERTTMIKKLYNSIYNTPNELKQASSRYCLNIFGGPLTIDDYRKDFQLLKQKYRLYIPPMASIIPLIERNNEFIIKRSANSKDDLRLKRSKPPIFHQYSLETTMGLQVQDDDDY